MLKIPYNDRVNRKVPITFAQPIAAANIESLDDILTRPKYQSVT